MLQELFEEREKSTVPYLQAPVRFARRLATWLRRTQELKSILVQHYRDSTFKICENQLLVGSGYQSSPESKDLAWNTPVAVSVH